MKLYGYSIRYCEETMVGVVLARDVNHSKSKLVELLLLDDVGDIDDDDIQEIILDDNGFLELYYGA